MKLYLRKMQHDEYGAVHGIDYTKGIEGGRICGVVHEFHTRNCAPIIYTEEEIEGNPHPEYYVKLDFMNPNTGIKVDHITEALRHEDSSDS